MLPIVSRELIESILRLLLPFNLFFISTPLKRINHMTNVFIWVMQQLKSTTYNFKSLLMK